MNIHTNHQIINGTDGKPAFVVVPYAEYMHGLGRDNNLIPNDVVGKIIMDAMSPVRAWREHLGLTQQELASRSGMSQAALSQIESGEHKIRKATKEKLANALGITLDQLG